MTSGHAELIIIVVVIITSLEANQYIEPDACLSREVRFIISSGSNAKTYFSIKNVLRSKSKK